MDLEKYESFKSTVDEFELDIRKLSALLTSLGAPEIQLNKDSTDDLHVDSEVVPSAEVITDVDVFEIIKRGKVTSEHISFPSWFKRSPYCSELPGYELMTADEIENRDKFINEWDLARFKIQVAIHQGNKTKSHSNVYDILEKKDITAEHITFPSWFKRSPYSSELPGYELLSPGETRSRDKFVNEWDLARYALITGSRRREAIYKIQIDKGIKTYFIEVPVRKAYWNSEQFINQVPSISKVPVPKEIMDEAVNYTQKEENPLKALGENYYRKFNRIMIDIFDLERAICGYGLHEEDETQMESIVDEVVNWLDMNVGSGKHVGKFRITEYAELLQERVHDLRYYGHISSSIIKELARDVDHLAFRVCTYFGYFYDTIKADLGMEAEAALNDLQERGNSLSSYLVSSSDYYEFEDEYDEAFDEVEEDDIDLFEDVFEEDDSDFETESEITYEDHMDVDYEYDDEYPFFELTGLKVVNYQSAFILTTNLVFTDDAPEDAVVVPVSITVKSYGRRNTTNSFNQVHKCADSMQQLSSFLILEAKSKSELCGKDIELSYYTSDGRYCTALYRCDDYGYFMFLDWKNRIMNDAEKLDYEKRLRG